ncbi:MAG: tetratricopeptide repeat protein [Planctomycetaceae bacterium]|nr:tetratricopeptide repeat protein [Planctomycetaceae bacterium]
MSTRSQILVFAAAIVVMAVASYQNTIQAPFIFDDIEGVVTNPTIHHLWPPGWLHPPYDSPMQNRPVANFTFAVNFAVGDTDVRGYHIVNLLIHILAGLTLLGLMRRTLELEPLRHRFGSVAAPLAGTIALIWLVHPAATEAVTVVTNRTESLVSLFYLLTMYLSLRAATAESKPAIWTMAILAAAACWLGMGSKEIMITAPLAVVLFDRVFVYSSSKDMLRRRWGLYLALAAGWAIVAARALPTGAFNPAVGFGHGVTVWQYACTQCVAVARYLALAFWPWPLVLDYGKVIITNPWAVIPCALLLAALLGLSVWALARRKGAGFLGVFFFLALIPSSSIVPLVTHTIAQKRMYLALAAVVTLAVLGAWRLWTLRTRRPGAWKWPAAAAALVVAMLGALTVARNHDFRSGVTIWSDTVTKCPRNSRAHSMLSAELLAVNNLKRALHHAQIASDLESDSAKLHVNLANLLLANNQHDQAIEQYRQALMWNGDLAEAHNNLGHALLLTGRPGEALQCFREALKRKPVYTAAQTNLADALMIDGKPQSVAEAVTLYSQALTTNSGDPALENALGSALQAAGRVDEAMAHYRRAAALAPWFPQARYNLGMALLKGNQVAEALEHLQQACRTPMPPAHCLDGLAQAYAAAGQYVLATEEAQRALEAAQLQGRAELIPQLRQQLEQYRRAATSQPASRPGNT